MSEPVWSMEAPPQNPQGIPEIICWHYNKDLIKRIVLFSWLFGIYTQQQKRIPTMLLLDPNLAALVFLKTKKSYSRNDKYM